MKLSYILNKGKIENCIKKDSSEIDIFCESPDWNASMINDGSLYDGDMLAEVDLHSLLDDGVLIKPLGPQRKYYDEYIIGDIDVSVTKFIATANDINKIPGYILSRFESNIFTILHCTVDEKAEIARNHIIPKKLSAFNLSSDDVAFSDEALYAIAKGYCSDAGPRELSGHITNLIRKVITEWSREIAEKSLCIDEIYLHEHLVSYKPKPSRRIGF